MFSCLNHKIQRNRQKTSHKCLEEQRIMGDCGVAQEVGSHGQFLQKVLSSSQCDLEKDELLGYASAESTATLGTGAALSCKTPVY